MQLTGSPVFHALGAVELTTADEASPRARARVPATGVTVSPDCGKLTNRTPKTKGDGPDP